MTKEKKSVAFRGLDCLYKINIKLAITSTLFGEKKNQNTNSIITSY